jgi:hypothetical protein
MLDAAEDLQSNGEEGLGLPHLAITVAGQEVGTVMGVVGGCAGGFNGGG